MEHVMFYMFYLSPDDALSMAKKATLDVNEPETTDDWRMILSCIAFNVHSGLEEAVCLLMKRIYDIPVSDEEITEIALLQSIMKRVVGIKEPTKGLFRPTML
jgi:hypothetical protein